MDNQDIELRDSLCNEIICNNIEDLNNIINCVNSITIMHLNIRSIEAHIHEFKLFLSTLHHKPSIIFLTEIWITPYPDRHNIDGYELLYNNSQITYADGTMAYIATDLQANSKLIEIGRTSIVVVTIGSETFAAIYRNHKTIIKNFLNDLNIYLENNKAKNQCIFGDINIDIIESNYEKNKYDSNIDTYMTDLHITRPSNKHDGGTCIDHIFL